MAQHGVLFVCLGNICRSPIAEAVMHDLATKQGVRDQWLIDSAATSTYQIGNPIYGSAQKVLTQKQIKYHHTARQIRDEDYTKYELILGFDHENLRNLEKMKPKNSTAQIRLITYFNEKNKNKIIEDPWYNDTPEAFNEVFQDCYDSCLGILKTFK